MPRSNRHRFPCPIPGVAELGPDRTVHGLQLQAKSYIRNFLADGPKPDWKDHATSQAVLLHIK